MVWCNRDAMRDGKQRPSNEHVMDTASKALWSTLIDLFSAVCVFVFVFVSVCLKKNLKMQKEKTITKTKNKQKREAKQKKIK